MPQTQFTMCRASRNVHSASSNVLDVEVPNQFGHGEHMLRISSWNVGTFKGRSAEVVETLARRNVDICCLQEVRWR